MAQRVCVVLVVVATGDLEDALAHQRLHRMLDRSPPPVLYLAGQGSTQPQSGVGLGNPGQTTIRGQATGVKGHELRLDRKQDRRALPCAKLGHEVSPGRLECG